MRVITRLKLVKNRLFFSTGPMELLQKIELHRSIRRAAAEMGMSYTKALRIIRVMEEELGFPVVVSHKGGHTRGATVLTERGRQMLTAFEGIYADLAAYAERLVAERFPF